MLPINVTIARPELWNNSNTRYSGATLMLPATAVEIEDAMDRARIYEGHALEVVECIDANGYEMDYLPEKPSLTMLNLLAHKLDSLEDYEHTLFIGMCKMEKEPPSMIRMLNITENLQDCLSIPADNYTELGKFYLDNDFIEESASLSDELFDCFDPAKIGRMMQKREGGIFIEGKIHKNYVIYNGSEIREVYNENNLPEIPVYETGYVFALDIKNKETGDIDSLDLPIEALDISDLSRHYDVLKGECIVPQLSESICAYSHYDIYELNSLAQKISNIIERGDYPKYKAMLSAFEADSLTDAMNLADTIDDYDFLPDVFCAEDYGMDVFLRSYNINPDDPALKHIRLADYGVNMMAEHNAEKIEYGFIRPSLNLQQEQKHNSGIGGMNSL
ncbi:MAG: hypothetical protein FWE74_05550 [Oscillospiraceae bacterium]|nr:hypothetical protein [Oscillospiraceae bacterium]